MERFREGDKRRRGCLLVASASFWEGFDVPGDALRLVIIDKLPFPAPGDPLMEARSQRIEVAGGRSFQMLAVPEAAVALKQGAGRLIRRNRTGRAGRVRHAAGDHGLRQAADARIASHACS